MFATNKTRRGQQGQSLLANLVLLSVIALVSLGSLGSLGSAIRENLVGEAQGSAAVTPALATQSHAGAVSALADAGRFVVKVEHLPPPSFTKRFAGGVSRVFDRLGSKVVADGSFGTAGNRIFSRSLNELTLYFRGMADLSDVEARLFRESVSAAREVEAGAPLDLQRVTLGAEELMDIIHSRGIDGIDVVTIQGEGWTAVDITAPYSDTVNEAFAKLRLRQTPQTIAEAAFEIRNATARLEERFTNLNALLSRTHISSDMPEWLHKVSELSAAHHERFSALRQDVELAEQTRYGFIKGDQLDTRYLQPQPGSLSDALDTAELAIRELGKSPLDQQLLTGTRDSSELAVKHDRANRAVQAVRRLESQAAQLPEPLQDRLTAMRFELDILNKNLLEGQRAYILRQLQGAQ